MRRRIFPLLAAALLIPPAIAAQLSSRALVSGTIQAIEGKTIHALSRNAQPVTLRLEPTSNIWKGRDGLDVSALKPGDRIYVDGFWNSDGSITVKNLEANIVNYFGRVIRVSGDEFEILPDRHTEPIRGVLSGNNPTTIINNGEGSAKDLQVGKAVQMVGLQREDGTILATRIWIYENPR